MEQRMYEMELLAPAGSAESLQAAVRCGADAVYLGGKHLNARRGAENFEAAVLSETVAYCHARNVKVYLTLNTMLFDSEQGLLRQALAEACAAGVDAVIVQDLGVAALARKYAPELALHASTQLSIHNLEGARLLEQMGFTRVVLAREMAAEEIRRVTENTRLAVECFVHGALCMCISGQCTLSSIIGGRSGNRGLCAQPCRLPFQAGDSSHALSLKDLSVVQQIPLLKELGVASLKIEGRMKRPEYVAGAVTTCRSILEGKPADLTLLEAVFSRTGFTDGYLEAKRGAPMFGTRQKEDVTAASPEVLKQLQGLYRKERPTVPVEFTLTLTRGKPALLTGVDGDGYTASAQGETPQEAKTAPTTPEKAEALLNKTGGTVYFLRKADCRIDDGLMMPASAINALRRTVLEDLWWQRNAVKEKSFTWREGDNQRGYRPKQPHFLRARLRRAAQFSQALAVGCKEVALPVEELLKLPEDVLKQYGAKLLAELPRAMFDNSGQVARMLQQAKAAGVTKALAGNLGGVYLAKQAGMAVGGDFGLNTSNTAALEVLERLELTDVTLSFELEQAKIRALGGTLQRGILAYGYLPLMLTRNCPVHAAQGCGGCGSGIFPELTDRKGNRFPVDCDGQAATLYNFVPLYLADRLAEFPTVDFFTLYFTREAPEQCAQVVEQYQNGSGLDGEKTRGLYYRKVL